MRRPLRLGQLATAVVVLVATRLVGCGSSIEASNYEQTCTRATDCVVVGVGDPCSTSCEVFPSLGAINVKDYVTYRQAAIAAQYTCSHCGTLPQSCTGTIPAPTSAYCVGGQCTICDNADPCTCSPHDPSCVDGAFYTDAGIEAAPDGESEAATPDAHADAAPAQTDAPAGDAPAEAAAHDAAGDAPAGDP